MKKSNLLIICVLAIALLAMPVSAYTHYFYLFNHGTMARTEGAGGESPANPEVHQVMSYGWGHHTVLEASPGAADPSEAWIDLPVTGIASYDGTHPLVRYATIQMRSETNNGGITMVHAYSGRSLLKAVDVNWYSSPGETWKDFTLDLGAYYDFPRGMNMDVLITSSTNALRYNEIGGYGAKAEW